MEILLSVICLVDGNYYFWNVQFNLQNNKIWEYEFENKSNLYYIKLEKLSITNQYKK